MDQVFGIAGDVAYDVAPNGVAIRAANSAATDRRVAYYHHPLTLLRAALHPEAVITNAQTADDQNLVDITTADDLEFTFAIDDATKLPTSVSSGATHPNLRDISRQTRFGDYENVGGLMLPTRLTEFVDDFRLIELAVTAQDVDGEVGDLTAPASAAATAAISGPPPANVTTEEVADGVWLMAGQSHHSVLIEFSDHLMLVEAPNEVRTLAVIAAARDLVPGKPLTQLVNTHHHFDHSGGIRAAFSEGLTIITHVSNAPFYRELANRASTMASDALAQNPQSATVEEVEDHVTHQDDSRTVELYHVAGNPHSASMLMVYLPQDGLLVEADAFNPGGASQPFAPNLLENIERLDLRVGRILPIHGGVATYDELVSAVQAMGN